MVDLMTQTIEKYFEDAKQALKVVSAMQTHLGSVDVGMFDQEVYWLVRFRERVCDALDMSRVSSRDEVLDKIGELKERSSEPSTKYKRFIGDLKELLGDTTITNGACELLVKNTIEQNQTIAEMLGGNGSDLKGRVLKLKTHADATTTIGKLCAMFSCSLEGLVDEVQRLKNFETKVLQLAKGEL